MKVINTSSQNQKFIFLLQISLLENIVSFFNYIFLENINFNTHD